jgi:uncharacterized protein (DUF2141 family)
MIKKIVLQNIILLAGYQLLISCAQFIPPTGGKKDEIAPKLVKSIPKFGQKNFKEKIISLEFDELIDISNLKQELLIIPEIESSYGVKLKGGIVFLKFSKPFKNSSTYTFNFRKGIKDLNEGNETNNLRLVFGTGNNIDSLKIDGNVKSLLTNQAASEIHVALYKLQDSLDIKKTKPHYFTKTDSLGNYQFQNIKGGKYRIYAFSDKNNNLKYDTKNEDVGFINDTINLNEDRENINLLIATANNEKPKVQKILQRIEDFTIIFDKNIKTFKVVFENKKDSIPYYGEGKELKFYNTTQETDTLKINIIASDFSENTINYFQNIKFRELEKKKKEKKIYVEFEVFPKRGEAINKNLQYELKFDKPISVFDTSKFKILSDTIREEILENESITWNKYKTKLTINKEIKAERELKILIEKGSFIDIKGDSSDRQSFKYPILKSENYGLVEGYFEEKKENKIVQIVNDKYEVIAEQKTKDRFIFENIKPNVYLLRIIRDKNNNAYWDCGNPDKNILPEEVYFYGEPIRIKANFEIRGLLIKQ